MDVFSLFWAGRLVVFKSTDSTVYTQYGIPTIYNFKIINLIHYIHIKLKGSGINNRHLKHRSCSFGHFKHFIFSEIFNDEFKILSEVGGAVFSQISSDVFQINIADRYEVFERSRA
jgi:hypothetical protein